MHSAQSQNCSSSDEDFTVPNTGFITSKNSAKNDCQRIDCESSSDSHLVFSPDDSKFPEETQFRDYHYFTSRIQCVKETESCITSTNHEDNEIPPISSSESSSQRTISHTAASSSIAQANVIRKHKVHSDKSRCSHPDDYKTEKVDNLKRKSSSSDISAKRHKTVNSTVIEYNHLSKSNNVWEQLSKEIWDLYHDKKQTSKVYDAKISLRDRLHVILLKTFPNCELYIVGSSITKLGVKHSDIDMCLMLANSNFGQQYEATHCLREVYRSFSQYDFLTGVELIQARVPILRFKDTVSDIDVDLNINNAVGIRNTQLLTSYARIDRRVAPLVLVVKLWAKCHSINDAKHNTLSSYSLTLMVIHYLQHACCPPVVPCLQLMQRDKFLPHSDVRTLKLQEDLPYFTSGNIKTGGELFCDFLHYFAYKFDFANDVISVRSGGIIPKLQAASNNYCQNNLWAHWKFVCIEEPFNRTNTACSMFKEDVFYYMKDVFQRSFNLLQSNYSLKSILRYT